MPTTDPSALPGHADYVVVGAGVAGLYTAWRILTNEPKASVVIVERLNRTGGRLHTDLIKFGDPSGNAPPIVREEEGGMRFNYSMRELMALLGELELCGDIVPFPMTGDNLRLDYRGRNFTKEESEQDPGIWAQLYDLGADERGKTPVQLLSEAYHRILEANGVDEPPAEPQPDFWQRFRLDFEWAGTTLNHWQLWGLLREMGYSHEAVVMMAHGIGFQGPFLSLMNAGEAFQLLEDFPSDPTYYTFKRGFSTLPNALVKQVEAWRGVISLSTNVDSIEGSDGSFALSMTVAPDGGNSGQHVPGGISKRMKAGKVVLALPRQSLESLLATSPALQADEPWKLRDELATTTNQQLLKINLYYDSPWWRTGDTPITYGPSYTDLPLNAVYPFYAINEDPEQSPAALTVYCDWDDANFWRGLQSAGEPFDSPLQKQHLHPPYQLTPASDLVVKQVTEQFRELFATAEVPDPVLTSFKAWDGESDNGYAVHQWGLDADDREVIADLVEPSAGIYTCNEAYSDMQGWVNGSLRSADLVLERFGITPLVKTARPCPPPHA